MGPNDHLGETGEPCTSCGFPLASDQRYCLNCGERRGEPKVDYLRYLMPGAQVAAPATAGPAEPAVAPAAPARAAARGGRDYTPLAAAGGVAILGLMLLVGVLIGRGNDTSQPVAAAPQVVTVSDTGTASSSGGSAADGGSAGAGAGDTKGAGDSKGGGDSGGGDKGSADLNASTGAAGEDTSNPVQASTEDLQALENASPEDYAQQSANLPDTIATPGEAPPPDNEAPGGGSGATTIK